MNLIQMSIAGACIILGTVLVRALALHKLPKRTFLMLWGVAFVRLVVPFSIPSPFALSALLKRSAPTIRTELAPAILQGTVVRVNPTPIQTPYIAATSANSPGVSIWVLLWLAGGCVCALLFALAYLRWHQRFRDSAPVNNAFTREWLEAHPLRRTVSIRQSTRITAPLTYGVFRPVILMPKDMNWSEEGTLEYVFAHEFTHIRRLDALKKLALAIVPCVHWFNPLVWVMYVLANRDIELACDEAVIRSIGNHAKKSYAFALLDLEERRSGLAILTNSFSRNAIEERIRAIMKMKKTTIPAILLAIILVFGIAAAFATSAPAETAAENGFILGDVDEAVEQPGDVADYSIYEPYGLCYDEDRSCFTYNGSVVAYFNDPIQGVGFTNYFTGTIELEPEYSVKDNTLIGIKECSPETYAMHAEKRLLFGKVREPSDSSEETAQPQTQSDELDWLREYAPYGIAYDADQHRLTYFGQRVEILIDVEKDSVYLSDLGDVCLVIQRNDDGAVSAIDACDAYQAQALLRSMIPQGGDLTVEAAAAAEAPDIDDAAMTETAIGRLAEHYPEMEGWIRSQYPDVVWWTVEDYSAWMTWEEARVANQLGKTVGWNSSGAVIVDQAYIEEQQAEHQETLHLLAQGWMMSKSINGDENLAISINPVDWATGRVHEFELSVLLNDGTEAHFGPYETANELLDAFIPFSEPQIASGNLDQSEATEIIEYYKSKT